MALQIDEDGNIYDDGVIDGNSVDETVTPVYDFGYGDPIPPSGGQGWQQDELGNFYKIDNSGGLTFRDDKGTDYTYNPSKGGFTDSKGNLAGGGNTVIDFLKKYGNKALDLFKDAKTGKTDWTKVLAMAGGAYAASRPNNIAPTGYQGKIPKLTASRNMLTAPPVGRRPGSGGIDYGGGASYRDEAGKLVSSNERTLEELRQAAINNPFNRGATYEGGSNLGGTDLIALLELANKTIPSTTTTSTTTPKPSTSTSTPSVEFTTGLGSSAPTKPVPLNSMNLPVGGPSQADRDAAFAKQNAEFEARKARRAAMRADMAARGEDARVAVTSPTNFTLYSPVSATPSGGVANQIGLAKGGLARDGFVLPADVVSHYGNGSSEAGLKLLAERIGATPIKGEGDGMSDSIRTKIDGVQEARVANDEAYVSPEMVAKLGNGNPEKGARKLYAMMDQVRKARTGTTKQGKEIDPNKYMPGGSVQRYQTGGTTATTRPVGATGSESSLSNWAGDYVTNMLGRGAALANAPYQAYTGPLTAGASTLQQRGFNMAGNLQTPSSIGQAAETAGGIARLASNMRYAPQTTSFLGEQNLSGIDMPQSYGASLAAPGPGSAGPGAMPPEDVLRQISQNPTLPGTNVLPARQYPQDQPLPSTNILNPGSAGPGAMPPEDIDLDGSAPVFDTNPGRQQPQASRPVGGIAQQYMNPYLQSALNPMMDEARRQADISRMDDAGRLTRAGAFGGGRQAIMESEGRRNLMDKQNQLLTMGYSTAYDKAMQQFNADQARRAQEAQFGATFGLQGLQTGLQGAQTQAQAGSLQSQSDLNSLRAIMDAGGVQRNIESEGIAADKAQFEEARLNPYKMLQFQQSLLSGMPLASQSYNMPSPSNLQQFAGGATTLQQLLDILSGKKTAAAK